MLREAGKTIGIIGYGNMGSAIAERLKGKYTLAVFDRDKEKIKGLTGVKIVKDLSGLLKEADVVILAVKPQDFDSVLNEINDYAKNKLIISIAAGVTTSYIEKHLGNAKVIRTMPNLPARIGKGMVCLSKGKYASGADLDFTKELFEYLGKTQLLSEKMMNAATAISGSGPGYYFDAVESKKKEYENNPKKFMDDFIVSLTEAAEGIGFDKPTAKFLAHWTIVYSEGMLKQTGLQPEELKKQVASRDGTTEAALEVLHNGGSLAEATRAAVRRAQELSKKE